MIPISQSTIPNWHSFRVFIVSLIAFAVRSPFPLLRTKSNGDPLSLSTASSSSSSLFLPTSSSSFYQQPSSSSSRSPPSKMMHMTFYWGKTVTILFDSWKTNSWPAYALSLLALFIASVFYQYMEDRRLQFKLQAASKAPQIETPLLARRGGKWAPARFAGAILFGINSAIGYLLMLAIMSFNGGVFVAVVLGLGVGYLLFRSQDGEDVVVVDSSCACA